MVKALMTAIQHFPDPARFVRAFCISEPMARSATFQSSSFGGDPLRALERSRAEEARAVVSNKDRATWGNAPIPEQPRRMTRTLEEFLAEEERTAGWSDARKAAEALFVREKK